MTTTAARPIDLIAARFQQVRWKHGGTGFTALCPAHDDHNPSLDVDDKGGVAVPICRSRGCTYDAILSAAGLSRADMVPAGYLANGATHDRSADLPQPGITLAQLAQSKRLPETFLRGLGLHDRPNVTHDGKQFEHVVGIPYRDANGATAVLPFTDREGRQRTRPAVKDRTAHSARQGSFWPWRAPLMVYGQERLAAAREAGYLILVEGESDCWTGWLHSFPVLGIPGAKNVTTLEAAHVEGIPTIYALHETDRAGDGFVAGIADRLAALNWHGQLHDLRLPGGVKDLNDLHQLDPDAFSDTLNAALASAPPVGQTPAAPPAGAPPGRPAAAANSDAPAPGTALTDLGNAERFIMRHGQNVRYIPRWGRWLVFDGRRWARDDVRRVQQLGIETVRSIYGEIGQAADRDEREAVYKHARRSESDGKIKAMLSLAESLPGIVVSPDDLDSDPWLLNCLNGTLDLRTGDLRPHHRDDLLTKLCPVRYDADATAPTWERFLRRVMGDNDELIAFLQRAVGYSLTGHTGEECLFFCYGTGRNGKSKFLGAVEYILGDYAKPTRPETFMEKKNEHTNDLAALVGARFVPTTETTEGKRLAEGLLKWATGSDKITARFLFQEEFDFRPRFKLWMAGNHKPTIRGSDEGIWSRIRLIPFTVVIPERERDTELAAKLEAEAPGILAWAVQGCLDWQIHRLGMPEAVREATQEYRVEMDLLAGFLADCCVTFPAAKVPSATLYAAYLKWCELNGEHPLAQRQFGRKLGERGFKRTKGFGATGAWGWYGVGLADVSDPTDPIVEQSELEWEE